MLVHQIHSSEGVSTPNVLVTDRTVSNARISMTCHSGIRLGADGVLYTIQANGGFSAISGQWLNNGTASTFYAKYTLISGSLEGSPPTEGSFVQLNANRDYDNQKSSAGTKTTQIFFELSSDASGVPIVDTATMNFTSEQGGL